MKLYHRALKSKRTTGSKKFHPRVAKYLKDNKRNKASFWRKNVLEYLFLQTQSFPQASLSDSCSHLGTENVRGQISMHIFAPNRGYRWYILLILKWVSIWRNDKRPNWKLIDSSLIRS